MKVIVYERDGGVAVVIPANKDEIEKVAMRAVPLNTPFWILENSELPSREFRDAWELDPDRPVDGYGGKR